MPLPDSLDKIAGEILDYFRDPATSPPYAIYVYEPDQELAVRREMQDLRAYLNAKGISVAAISLAELFWQAVDESSFYDSIVETEKASPNDPWALQQVDSSLQEILTEKPSLADRVITALEDKPKKCAVILYRAGALYPVFRTSALLDDIRERLKRPVVLLYPGHAVDPYGLKFMGKCEPAHGYRAKIFQRSSS
jgi:BREX protein BrxB